MEPTHTQPLLSADDERVLARVIEAGVIAGHLLECGDRPVQATDAELSELAQAGRAAWEQFLLANLRLVHKLAGREARRSGLPVEDLFQEGCLALAGALQRFDPDRARFAVYAAGRIGRHLSDLAAGRLGALGLPVSQAVALRRAKGVLAELTQERRQQVTTGELAQVLGCDRDQVERLLGYRCPVGLVMEDSHAAIAGLESDPDRRVLDEQLRREVGRLSPELATVVRLRFGLEHGEALDLSQIARRLGVSVSTARRREMQALELLRRRLDLGGLGLDALAG